MATVESASAWEGKPTESIEAADLFDPSVEFRDDLIAANRFKTFLVSSGVEVSERVIAGLAKLTSEYLHDSRPTMSEGVALPQPSAQPRANRDPSASSP